MPRRWIICPLDSATRTLYRVLWERLHNLWTTFPLWLRICSWVSKTLFQSGECSVLYSNIPLSRLFPLSKCMVTSWQVNWSGTGIVFMEEIRSQPEIVHMILRIKMKVMSKMKISFCYMQKIVRLKNALEQHKNSTSLIFTFGWFFICSTRNPSVYPQWHNLYRRTYSIHGTLNLSPRNGWGP